MQQQQWVTNNNRHLLEKHIKKTEYTVSMTTENMREGIKTGKKCHLTYIYIWIYTEITWQSVNF